MARRTLAAMADSIEDRFDKDRTDTTFDAFVQDMLILTLQEINTYVPWSRWLMDEVSLTATVSGTQYISMPADLDLESLISITDRATTNRKVRRISPMDADEIDPGRDMTGDEILWWYQRVETMGGFEDRIYFLNQPDSVDTLSAIFGVIIPQPTANQTAVLPEKYEPIWMDGAMEKVWDRIDPGHPNKSIHRNNFKIGLEIIKRDANRAAGESTALASHRPRQGAGIQGASFPSNYDITP